MLRNRKYLRKIEKPAMRFTNTRTMATFQPRQRLGEDQEKEEESPRAGNTCSAGPGPNTKHVNRPPGPTADFRGDTNAAEGRDTPYGVNQGHNEDKDPGATDDRREQPQPGPAEGSGPPEELQQRAPLAALGPRLTPPPSPP